MRKKLIILLQMIIIIALLGTSVLATVSATLELKVSANAVKKGDELTVTLSLKDVDSEQKVRSISGYINYDHSVIEELTVDNIVKSRDNTVEIGNETLTVEDLTNRDIDDMPDTSAYIGFNSEPTSGNDIRIVIDFNNGITEDVDLLTMKFKVKSNATIGEVENAIEYKMFVITAGTSDRSEEISENVKLTITNITDDNNDSNNNNNNTNNDGNNDNGNNGNNTNNDDNNNSNNGDDKENKTNNRTNNTKNTTNTNKNTSTNRNKNTNKTVVGGNTKKNNTSDNTIASSVLPATGAKAIIIPAIVVTLCAYIFYNKYMKYNGI